MTDSVGLPWGWAEAIIDDVLAPLADGRTLHQGWSPQCALEPADDESVWGVLRTTAIQDGRFLPEENKRLPEDLSPRPPIEVAPGDLLVTCAGPRARCGVACLVRATRPRLMLTGKMYRFRMPEECVDSRFMEAQLRTPRAQSAIDRMKTGISDSGLNLTHDRFRGLPVLVAPWREQQRIVEAIESYLTRLDNAVALLERVEQNLKRYRASVLKAAVEGRLVPTEAELARREGRTYEPASELLKRILAERKARWIEDAAEKARAKAEEKARKAGKPWTDKDNAATLDKERAKAAKQYEEPAAPDTTDLPDLPEGWCWTTLESIFASITDGDHVAPPQSPEGIPFLVIGDVRDGTIHLLGTRHVPREYYVQLDPARKPAVGDILYTVTGSFGIPVFVDSDVEFCVQRHIAILRPAPEVNARFLTKLLRSQPVFLQASDVATGTAQKTVGLQKLRAITVPLPPEAEQNRLLGELERAESLALSVGAAIVRATSRAVRLRQSILKWAFEGKLVKQDPSDEPASALLERIKATGPQSHLRRRES